MTIQELFIASNKALQRSVDHIRENQWDLPMPKGTSRKPTTLREAVRHHTYDDAWVPDVLAGKTKEEVGDTYDYLLTTGNVVANFSEYNQRAIDAVSDFKHLDDIVHLSYGDYPAREYLQHITSFRAFRSYDIAKLIDGDITMDPEFVEALMDEFSPVVEWYRRIGIFPEPIEVADDATPQEKLLAMVGRR